jgi:hypothetical protein
MRYRGFTEAMYEDQADYLVVVSYKEYDAVDKQ